MNSLIESTCTAMEMRPIKKKARRMDVLAIGLGDVYNGFVEVIINFIRAGK
jgi:hypothetical protein